MTDGFACRTMLPSASYGLSPWAEEIGPSPAPTSARLTAHLAISL
jgi:hypothetical protein